MFSKFKYTPTDYFDNSKIYIYSQIGADMYNEFEKQSQKALDEFITPNGRIDGTALQENWFSITKADVFLSHSHKDINKVKAFAGWLKYTFGLTSFIDSCCWGYCDKLLRIIDDDYCYNDLYGTYSYELRNYSTSHVHMMLSSALSQMIDNTECIIFFDTPNSIVLKDELLSVKNGNTEATLSPWIYHELSMSTMIRQTRPEREKITLEHSSQEIRNALDIQYEVGRFLKNMKSLTNNDLSKWKERAHPDEFALDTLYKMLKNREA